MTANQLIELMNRSPFEPLEIHLADRTTINVEHPYQIATKPHSQACVIYEDDERMRFVAYRNITEIITKATSSA